MMATMERPTTTTARAGRPDAVAGCHGRARSARPACAPATSVDDDDDDDGDDDGDDDDDDDGGDDD